MTTTKAQLTCQSLIHSLTLTHSLSHTITHSQSPALCDPCLRTVQAGEVVQLERKGFYRCDKAYGGSDDKPAVLFYIPDGKASKTSAAKK